MKNSHDFKKVGVIGAGVMGAQIAALLAGVGVDVELLDIVPPEGLSAPPERSDANFRNRFAVEGKAKLGKMRPPPFYAAGDAARIRPGNLEDHLGRLSECGWVIEVVTERLDIKHALYKRLGAVLNRDAVLSSNTSGILRRMLVEGMDEDLSRRFIITHFFNPPRYMKLLEIVAGDADPAAVKAVAAFAGERLGKGVVLAKDTPLFIANRIGVFHVLDLMHCVVEKGWPIEAVDAVLGRASARPKSGIFRTADLAGLDTLSFVAAELVKGCPEDEWSARCRIPQFLQQMVVRGMTGDKAGRGFYFKDKESGHIMALDPAQLSYRPRVSLSTPSLTDALRIADPAERVKRVVFADDQAGEIAWPAVSRVIAYAANRIPEISDDLFSVDRAMRWGYNWELGPFEIWDALGLREVAERLEREGSQVPRLVEEMLREGRTHFYEWRSHRRMCFDPAAKKFASIEGSEERVTIARLKSVGRLVEENAGASLVDVGDGVFACEFHTKMNAIDEDVIRMIHSSIDRVEKEEAGLLIANEGEQFSVGANILLIFMAAEQKRWDEISTMVREFQSASQRIRFAQKPVMAVPFGMALGGGCEICLAACRRTAAIETYMGLVEAGVGLIPAGGGCKNLLLMMEAREQARRGRDALAGDGGMTGWPDRPPCRRVGGGPQPKVSAAFELIAMAKVSGSARDAMGQGLLAKEDFIVMDRELLLREAKKALIEMSKVYAPPAVRNDICLPGRGGEMALVNGVAGFVKAGKATEYDAFIAGKLAHVLAGGDMPTIHETSEEHILDLEREAFLSLVGEEKTRARIAHMLKTGKPLRN
ncbi:MAG: 3-hydroxyacyl-CoA dehydrogenase/enoyl-CoA hydratase family protein [Pseudomonadota bacterium]